MADQNTAPVASKAKNWRPSLTGSIFPSAPVRRLRQEPDSRGLANTLVCPVRRQLAANSHVARETGRSHSCSGSGSAQGSTALPLDRCLRRLTSRSTQRCQEHMPRPEKPGLHCRNARLEPLRCFLYAELLKVTKDQNLPILCRKSNNGAANRVCGFSAGKRLMRRFAWRSERIEITVCLRPSRTVLPAIGLQNLIDGHTNHPRTKA
jgi:hypothetical protein